MKPFRYLISVLALVLASCGHPAYAIDLYVDGLAGKDTNAGTQAAPFQSVWKGWISAKPGDVVHLLPTVTYQNIWLGKNAGLPGKPITIKGAGVAPNRTKVVGINSKDAIMLDASAYVRIENLDIESREAIHRSAHGVYVKTSHHVDVINNRVKGDCAGIQYQHSDWITIRSNEVYDSSKRTLQNIWCSGISTHEALDVDDNTADYKIVITDNIVYGSLNVAEPNCTKCSNSDGSGIIIDDSRRTQTDNRAFKGRHLVANNVLYNNGGRGITSYISDNVDIFNNTVHFNNTDPAEGAWRPGEITVDQGINVRVMYNILSSDGLAPAHTGQHVGVNVTNTTGNIEVAHNLIWNPQGDATQMFFMRNNSGVVLYKEGNRFAPVAFVKPGIDGAANYRVKSTTNAHKGFVKKPFGYATTDITGKSRARAKTISAGAYQ